jgi:hypothetical protein
MLGGLGATLIVFAVMHLLMVTVLARRPHGGYWFALLAVACAAGAGCVVDAWLVPGHLAAAAAAGAVAVLASGCYAVVTIQSGTPAMTPAPGRRRPPRCR